MLATCWACAGKVEVKTPKYPPPPESDVTIEVVQTVRELDAMKRNDVVLGKDELDAYLTQLTLSPDQTLDLVDDYLKARACPCWKN